MKARTHTQKTSRLQICVCGCVCETYTLYVERRALSKRPLCHRTHCPGPLAERKALKASVYIYTWRVSNYFCNPHTALTRVFMRMDSSLVTTENLMKAALMSGSWWSLLMDVLPSLSSARDRYISLST
jgi:hypothetical protein